MEQQDIFIAYHGTYNDEGSLDKARELFYFLQSSGVKCFFFPNESNSYFANTPVAAQKSKKLIFVCNFNVTVNDDGTIRNNGVFQEITSFWNCIYEGSKQRGDARAYVYDGFSSEKANKLHIAFQGVAHFDENLFSQEECFENVLKWVTSFSQTIDASKPTKQNATFEDRGTSTELKKVFTRRAVMNKSWDLAKMVAVAKKIECLGISNNEMTLNMDADVLRNALNNGTKIELLFLDPRSKFVRFREREEKQEKNTIKNNTEATLSFIRRMKNSGANGVFENLKIYTYDLLPRMNMIFIDERHLLLQYYANSVPGASNPCFYIKRQDDNQLFDFYHKQYEQIRKEGKELK